MTTESNAQPPINYGLWCKTYDLDNYYVYEQLDEKGNVIRYVPTNFTIKSDKNGQYPTTHPKSFYTAPDTTIVIHQGLGKLVSTVERVYKTSTSAQELLDKYNGNLPYMLAEKYANAQDLATKLWAERQQKFTNS